MTQAWQADLPTGRKMVLLSLCDNASDQGECYPSIEAIAKRCGMTDRSVYNHLAALEQMGMLERQDRHGRSNLYRLNPCKFFTPETVSPLKPFQVTPETVSGDPETISPPVPETISPITIIEPSLNRQVNRQCSKSVDVKAAVFGLTDIDAQVLADWFALRKRRKADVTATVVADLRKQAELAGLSVEDAMRTAIRRGWTGFEAAWVASADRPATDAAPARQSRHSGFAGKDYRKGVADDGSFA